MFSISQTGTFEASHYIRKADTESYYKQLHGHSFVVNVRCSAPDVESSGWVLDLGVLKTKLDEVLNDLDHKILNDVEGLDDPTLENILKFIDESLKERGIKASLLQIERPTLGQAAFYEPRR